MNTNKTIVIDNYDSFTYNLVHMIEEIIQEEPTVVRNDQVEPDKFEAYSHIILSPGPSVPSNAGRLLDIIRHNYQRKKIFGVCLGLQAIGEVFNSELRNLNSVYHGQQTTIQLSDTRSPIFKDLDETLEVGRYHSWVIDKEKIGTDLLVTSRDSNGEIMSARHKHLPVYGVQFHPESILTPDGSKMLSNFYNYG